MNFDLRTRFAAVGALAVLVATDSLPRNTSERTPRPIPIRVHALVVARSAEADPTLIRLPLPFIEAQDEAGHRFVGDSEGKLDLTGSLGEVKGISARRERRLHGRRNLFDGMV